MIALYAALALQAPAGSSGSMLFLIQIVLIGAIFYFLMIRPQQKQRQRHEETLRAIKKGDEIVTAGGIVGKVVHVREAPRPENVKATGLDDRVTIESGESRLVVERGKIARIISGVAATP
jgi:preprotein translocase subunit YajC